VSKVEELMSWRLVSKTTNIHFTTLQNTRNSNLLIMFAKNLIMNIPNLFLSVFFFFFSLYGFSQNNLITVNPDFIENIDGWSSSGNCTLEHQANGALTPGAAKVTVLQPSENYSKVRLKTLNYSIPDELRNQMLTLTFYAKSPQNNSFRILFRLYDNQGNSYVVKSKSYQLDTDFQKIFMPVFIESNITNFELEVQCGINTGVYIFDDFLFYFNDVSTSEVSLLEEWKPKTFEKPQNVVWQTAETGDAPITVSIFPADSLAPFFGTQIGVNSNFRSKNSITNRVNLYKPFGAFRFPAGSGSNQYFFDCNIPDSFAIDFDAYCGTSNQFTDPEHYVQLLQEAGGEGTVVVNYFYARYGITPEGTREARVKQAAGYAASFVRKMNIELNAGIKYWEIGNECNGSWETGYDVNGSIVTGKEYGEDLRVFADSMRAVDPTIKIGAVLAGKDFSWNSQVIKEVENSADFFIIHHYFSDVESALLSKRQLKEIENDVKKVELLVSEFTDKPAGYFPVTLTEFNIEGEHTTTIVNGLFTAEALINAALNHFSLSTIWVNEWNISEDNITHGIITKNDPDQMNYTARPVYTPFYYYNACFGDHLIKTETTGTQNVRSYGSLFNSGELGLSLINYDNQSKTIRLNFPHTSGDTVYLYSVYADNQIPGNKKFYINGLTSDTPGGGPVNLDEVPAIAMTWTDNSVLVIPKHSINFIVIKGAEGFLDVKEKEASKSLKIFPVPAKESLTVQSSSPVSLKNLSLYDITGKNITRLVKVNSADNFNLRINISGLSEGIYLIRVGNIVQRFIKE
jgi:hypothetical protein